MKFNDLDDRAIAWYKSLSLWAAAAVAFGAGFFTHAILF